MRTAERLYNSSKVGRKRLRSHYNNELSLLASPAVHNPKIPFLMQGRGRRDSLPLKHRRMCLSRSHRRPPHAVSAQLCLQQHQSLTNRSPPESLHNPSIHSFRLFPAIKITRPPEHGVRSGAVFNYVLLEMQLFTMLRAKKPLLLFAALCFVFVVDVNLLFNVFDETPPLVEAAFGLRFKRDVTVEEQLVDRSIEHRDPNAANATIPAAETTVVTPTPSSPVVASPTVASPSGGSPTLTPTSGCSDGAVLFNGTAFPKTVLGEKSRMRS